METWNEEFKNDIWISQLYESEPRAFQSESYLLGGTSLRDDVTCKLEDNCIIGKQAGKGENDEFENDSGKKVFGTISYSWVFCYACNRIYHLACQGHRTSNFKQLKLIEPYRCNECVENPMNLVAKEFYGRRNEMDMSMNNRREFFTKSYTIDLSKTVTEKATVEEEANPSRNGENDDLKSLLEKFNQSENEKRGLMDELKKCYEHMSEFGKLKAEVLELRKQVFESKAETSLQKPSTSRENPKLRFSTSTVFSPSHSDDSPDNLMRDPIPSNFKSHIRRKVATVPVPKQRKSFIENMDMNELTRTERITLEQAQAQIDATEAQREIASTQNLTVIRKALPRITKFDGDPKKWIQFKRDVDRYKTIGKYDDYEMRIHVLQALEGIALSRVQGAIDKVPLDDTMKALKKCFGEPTRIIDKCAKDILAIKVPKELFKDDVLLITSKIQEYMAACNYAGVQCPNSNQLATHIFEQLNLLHKQLFRHNYREEHPNAECRLIELDDIYSFLESVADDLEDKRMMDKKFDEKKAKSFQMNVTSVKPTTYSYGGAKTMDDYMYEIKDKNSNPLGYDLKALGRMNKYCDCCMNAGHYTIQCRKYKMMDASEKLRFVNEKNICRNCIITSTHRSYDCLLKDRCGYREFNDKCVRKHHITLHKALSDSNSKPFNTNNRSWGNGEGGNRNSRFSRPFKRNNAKFNQRKAESIAKESEQSKEISNCNKSFDGQREDVIKQAPTINDMPDSQVAFFNKQFKQKAIVTAASGGSNSNNESSHGLHSLLVYSLGAGELHRTVKVFKNAFIGPKGYVIHYSLGDSAAEVTLVKDELREILGLNGEKCELTLQWTDGSLKTVEATKIDIVVWGMAKYCKKITLKNCYAVPDLYLPKRSLDIDLLKSRFPYLRDVEYESYVNISPSMLLGSPHASVFESIDRLLEGGVGKPVGLRAKLGWTVYGGCPEECCNNPFHVESINLPLSKKLCMEGPLSNEMLYELYSQFCSIESLGIANKTSHNTEQEQKALDYLKQGMRTLEDGTIEVPLIWNCVENDLPSIPNNFAMVYKRQVAHERVLAKNPLHLKAFNDNFVELLSQGYVRPACAKDLDGDWPNVSYIPMSLVKNANKDPPKFRNVFDASARFHGVSLNDHLLKGPDLLVDLTKPLLRMRENKIAFTADIKSMYMRVKIATRDQQVQRVLWRPNTDEEFRIFVFSSMLFGPTSSPFTSQFVKNATADKWKDQYPDAVETIKECMYMDDLLTSETSNITAIAVAKQCIEIFDSINWKLVSFQSNSLTFLKSLPVTNISQDTIPLLESEKDSCVTKVLGCVWDTKNDAFVFKFDKNLFIKIVKDCQHRPTKRDQCSTIARIFDVLGLISHFIIRGKILLQRSWLSGIDWDDEVSAKEHTAWIEWLNDIECISQLKIPRRYNSLRNLNECDAIELHTFADAGGEAFAAVSYLVTEIGDKRYSNIVMAKAKVTPIRHKSRTQISEMPRLELCACLIASRLADTITRHYSHVKLKRYFWNDSEVVLRWIVKPNHRLLKYAISPVEEILEKTTRDEWRYVPTKLNVADIATKFQKFNFGDSNSVWFTGPGFLRQSEDHWPQMPILNEPPVVPETVMINVLNFNSRCTLPTHKLPPVDWVMIADSKIDTRFKASIKSSWRKLVRATARGLKLIMDGFIPLVKTKKFEDLDTREKIKALNEKFELIDVCDRERAERFLVRKAQRDSYPDEYECLRKNREVTNIEMKQLNVFLDADGLIRINARVNLGYELYPQKYAPLLPRKHWITKRFLEYVHEEHWHIHLESQVAFARSKYWIPQVRTALQAVQDNCNLCSFMRAIPYAPKMAPLPDCRTNPSNLPFETTGLDCMGPFTVLNYNKPKKVWVVIFTCTLTRFIHLRVLQSLETIKVLEAIVEFWASHGPVRTFISDRGSNFVGASNVLEEDRKATMNFLRQQYNVLKPQLIEKYQVEWKLLPAHSPWMGGVYERLIREVKRAVSHVINEKRINIASFNIALNDAAHRINNRPLTHNAVSADDAPVLTPHLLAKGRCGWPYLPGLQSSPKTDGSRDRSVYRGGRAVADEIMRRFYRFYLPVLTKRVKWFKDVKPIKAGDLVLLIEPNETRKEWKRARVERVYKGRDGRARVADVMLPDKTIKKSRSIQRLAKIEIKSNE